jgi:hypothetical protein
MEVIEQGAEIKSRHVSVRNILDHVQYAVNQQFLTWSKNNKRNKSINITLFSSK